MIGLFTGILIVVVNKIDVSDQMVLHSALIPLYVALLEVRDKIIMADEPAFAPPFPVELVEILEVFVYVLEYRQQRVKKIKHYPVF